MFPKDSRNNILASKSGVSAKLNKCKIQYYGEDNVVERTVLIMEYEIVRQAWYFIEIHQFNKLLCISNGIC
jgi:hypothetical protein